MALFTSKHRTISAETVFLKGALHSVFCIPTGHKWLLRVPRQVHRESNEGFPQCRYVIPAVMRCTPMHTWRLFSEIVYCWLSSLFKCMLCFMPTPSLSPTYQMWHTTTCSAVPTSPARFNRYWHRLLKIKASLFQSLLPPSCRRPKCPRASILKAGSEPCCFSF